MNIFILDTDQKKCAQYHSDTHVVKMILETAQILSTVCHKNGVQQKYRPTHKNHPCTLWAEKSLKNYMWLAKLGLELGNEYTHRYGKEHKSVSVILQCMMNKPDLPDTPMTPFAQAMPDQYRDDDAVVAYRSYYIGEKKEISSWKQREIPEWFDN